MKDLTKQFQDIFATKVIPDDSNSEPARELSNLIRENLRLYEVDGVVDLMYNYPLLSKVLSMPERYYDFANNIPLALSCGIPLTQMSALERALGWHIDERPDGRSVAMVPSYCIVENVRITDPIVISNPTYEAVLFDVIDDQGASVTASLVYRMSGEKDVALCESAANLMRNVPLARYSLRFKALPREYPVGKGGSLNSTRGHLLNVFRADREPDDRHEETMPPVGTHKRIGDVVLV